MNNEVNHALKTAATNDEKLHMLKIYINKKEKKKREKNYYSQVYVKEMKRIFLKWYICFCLVNFLTQRA